MKTYYQKHENQNVPFPYKICFRKVLEIKKEQPRRLSGVVRGDPSGIRTPDTLIKSQVLCQLS